MATLRLTARANSGHRPWLARIVGTHTKFVFARQFLRGDESGLTPLGRTGEVVWEVDEPGLYELGGSKRDDAFLAVIEEGDILTERRVREPLVRRVALRLDAGEMFEDAWAAV
jgi:hypothetical protein